MYADLASPVSSASSQSQVPAQQQKQKEKVKPKKEETPREKEREERRKREIPPQPQKTSAPKPAQISKPPQLVYSAHKDIKLTLLNKPADKGTRKRYEPSDKERPSSPPSKRVALSPERGHRERKPFGRPPSPKGDRQSTRVPPMMRSSPAQADRKRAPSPQSKVSSKVTSVSSSSKSHDVAASATAASSAKSSKSNTLSRREELLKQPSSQPSDVPDGCRVTADVPPFCFFSNWKMLQTVSSITHLTQADVAVAFYSAEADSDRNWTGGTDPGDGTPFTLL